MGSVEVKGKNGIENEPHVWELNVPRDAAGLVKIDSAFSFFRKLLIQISLLPLHKDVAQILQKNQITPVAFTDLDLESSTARLGNRTSKLFSYIENVCKAIDRGFGGGSKDDSSLEKIAKSITQEFQKVDPQRSKLWTDLVIEIDETKSQHAVNPNRALAYLIYRDGKEVLKIAPHILNPSIRVPARKFVMSIIIGKYLALRWVQYQRTLDQDKDPNTNRLFKSYLRRVKLIGIKGYGAQNEALASVFVARELITNFQNKKAENGITPLDWIKNQLSSEVLCKLRFRQPLPAFISPAQEVLGRVDFRPQFTWSEIYERTETKGRDKIIQNGISSVYGFVQSRLGDDTVEFKRATAKAEWLARKGAAKEVICATFLAELNDNDFEEALKKYLSKGANLIANKAVLIAQHHRKWRQMFDHPLFIPTDFSDNCMEQNELDRVVSGWTLGAQEITKAIYENFSNKEQSEKLLDKNSIEGWINKTWKDYRHGLAMLSSADLIFELDQDYSSPAEDKIKDLALIAEHSLVRGLYKLGMDDVAAKVSHQVLIHRPKLYNSINSAMRDKTGLTRDQSKDLCDECARNFIDKLKKAGISDVRYDSREKTPASEKDKCIDSYIENLDRMSRGEKSIYSSDSPDITEISSFHIDTLGLRLEFKTEEDLIAGLKVILPEVKESKLSHLDSLLAGQNMTEEGVRFYQAKINEVQPPTRDPVTGNILFMKATLLVERGEKIIPIDVHFATSEFVELAKNGMANVKYAQSHEAMKNKRKNINFCFLSFCHQKGIGFGEQGIPKSINQILSVYSSFKKSLDNYSPERSYVVNLSNKDYKNPDIGLMPIETSIHWDGDKISIELPKETILTEVFQTPEGEIRIKNERTLANSRNAEIGIRVEGDKIYTNLIEHKALHSQGIVTKGQWPGVRYVVIGRQEIFNTDKFSSPKGSYVVLDQRNATSRNIPSYVPINNVLGEISDQEVDPNTVIEWDKKLFGPAANLFGLTAEQLKQMIVYGTDESLSQDTVDYLTSKLQLRLQQMYLRTNSDGVNIDSERKSVKFSIQFDERRAGLFKLIQQFLDQESKKAGLKVSTIDYQISYPEDPHSLVEKPELEVTLWRSPEDPPIEEEDLEKLRDVCQRVVLRFQYELFDRMKVASSICVEREFKVTLPVEYQSLKRFGDAITDLGYQIKSVNKVDPQTGECVFIIACEDLLQHGAISMDALRADNSGFGKARRYNKQIKQNLLELLKNSSNKEYVECIDQNLNIKIVGDND